VAPLHRRFDEADSLRQIKDRYLGVREKIADQVSLLQSDERFLARSEDFYKDGYKDWHILAAIINFMVHLKHQELGNFLRTKEDRARSKDTVNLLKGTQYPVEKFLTKEIEMHFTAHAMTCLSRYGFEPRASLSSNSTIKFLRERMRHFDLDIPHTPMFGHPPGDWPSP
jgi:hypothetical protein